MTQPRTLLTVPIDKLLHERDNRPDAPLDDLLSSIQVAGLQVPPLVLRLPNGAFKILDGNRRVKSCRKLGITELQCLLFETDDMEHEAHRAELAAISSNLGRRDLPAAVRAVELARYKAIYEDLFPTTAMGKAPKGKAKKGRPDGDLSERQAERYTMAAAKLTGMGERSVQRLVAIGERASLAVLKALDEKHIGTKDAEILAQLPKREQPVGLARVLEEREYRKAGRESASAVEDGSAATGDTGAAGDTANEDPIAQAVSYMKYAAQVLGPLTSRSLNPEKHRLVMDAQKALSNVLDRFGTPVPSSTMPMASASPVTTASAVV